ncbi:MAG TPA: hypothetical protein VKY36_00735 [Moheibacter sp.]|nr:hypothetical protein [Moheibacter sp.]
MEYKEKLEKGSFYHIFNRGNNKEDLFPDDNGYAHFLKLISKHIIPIANVYAYCPLKNHFHLLIQIKEAIELKEDKLHQPFSNLFNAYAKTANKIYKREGSLFRSNYKRIKIKDENQLINTILYIHLNPVKHGFTDVFRNYEHSSFQTIISEKPTKLTREFVLNLFENKENFIASHQIKVLEKFDLDS